MRERNPAIELWRVFCMLAITVQHIGYNNGVFGREFFQWHVPGFLIISGFFGVRFTPVKVLKLVGVAYGCYWLTIWFRGWHGVGPLLVPHGGWFLPFYLVLMLLSPLLNAAMRHERGNLIFVSTVFLLVCGWLVNGFATTNVHIGMMLVPGMGGNGFLMLIGIYVVSASLVLNRLWDNRKWLPLWFGGFLICVVISGFLRGDFMSYGNPLAILAAYCGFRAFKLMPISGRLGRFICLISPSMFSVYLLQECCVRHWQIMPNTFGALGILGVLTWAIVVFIGCILIDAIRRTIAYAFLRVAGNHLHEIDKKWMRWMGEQ